MFLWSRCPWTEREARATRQQQKDLHLSKENRRGNQLFIVVIKLVASALMPTTVQDTRQEGEQGTGSI